MEDSLFTKIRKGDIPGKIVYEDDLCFAIEDINPQAPVHILIIPIKEIEKVSDASEKDINPSCYIVMTDMYDDFPEEPDHPVLWMSVTPNERLLQYNCIPDYGRITHLKI